MQHNTVFTFSRFSSGMLVQQKLQVSNYTSIKQLIYSYILASTSIYTHNHHLECIENKNISLSKGRNNILVFYISGVALQLANSEKIPPMEIANTIGSHISTIHNNEFNIQIVAPGWIHLEVTHPFLATWLQHLIDGHGAWGMVKNNSIPNTQYPIPNTQFTVQYAHARCCSLLRLADREGLIKNGQSLHIPWLDCNQIRFNHWAEYCLITELVEVVDRMCSSKNYRWEKVALSLSQAFESFWSNCRIWGQVKTTSPELAQARLGLVMATQSLLRFLLEEKLSIFALSEL